MMSIIMVCALNVVILCVAMLSSIICYAILSVIMLSDIKQNVGVQSIVMLSVVRLLRYTECDFAECC
jgi:hypothetical protein